MDCSSRNNSSRSTRRTSNNPRAATLMANLFQTALTESDLSQIMAASPPVNLLPHLGSNPWEAVALNPIVAKWMVPLRKLAIAEFAKPMPELTENLYHDFFKTGSRVNFESVYFERRRKLGRAAICALLEADDARWMTSVQIGR